MAIFKQPNVSELVNKWCRPTQRPCRVILSPAQGQLLGLSHRLPQKQPKTQFWQFLAETKKGYSHSFIYEKGPLGTFAGAKKIKKKRRATTVLASGVLEPFRAVSGPDHPRCAPSQNFFCPNLQAINLLSRETTKDLIKKIPRAFPAIFSSELKTTFFDSLSEMTHHGTVLAQKSWPTGLIVSPRAVLSARLSNSKFFDNSRSGLIPLCSNS